PAKRHLLAIVQEVDLSGVPDHVYRDVPPIRFLNLASGVGNRVFSAVAFQFVNSVLDLGRKQASICPFDTNSYPTGIRLIQKRYADRLRHLHLYAARGPVRSFHDETISLSVICAEGRPVRVREARI